MEINTELENFLSNSLKNFEHKILFKLLKIKNKEITIYPYTLIFNDYKLNILNVVSPKDIQIINSLKLSVDNYIDLDIYKQKIRARFNINAETDPQKYILIDNYIESITKSDKINQNLYIYNVDYSTGGGNNFYHFFIHYLPKLYIYIKFINIFRKHNYKLLINYKRLSNWQKDILNILNINIDDMYLIDDNKIIINKGINLIPEYPNLGKGSIDFLNIIYDFYHEKIIKKVLMLHKNINKEYPTNIIILRKKSSSIKSNTRHIINRDDIISFVKKYNFIEIDSSNLKIEESIKIFNNADNIIIEGGSGCINIFWTKNKSNIIVINTLDKLNKLENLKWDNTNIISNKNIKIIDSNKPDIKFGFSNNKNDKYYNLPFIFDGFDELKKLLDNK
jgi:hypothetical protein